MRFRVKFKDNVYRVEANDYNAAIASVKRIICKDKKINDEKYIVTVRWTKDRSTAFGYRRAGEVDVKEFTDMWEAARYAANMSGNYRGYVRVSQRKG